MGSRLNLLYDNEGDVLYIESVRPYEEQRSNEIAEGVVTRMNPETGDVEGLEIFGFSARFSKLDDLFTLPLAANMKLVPA